MPALRARLMANWQGIVIFVIFLLTFATFNILFDASTHAEYFKEILAALIGTILAAVVTTMLLRSQTRGEELKEQNVEVFRSKLRAYDQFVSSAVDSLNDDQMEVEEVLKLKKLAYQIALISSDETVAAVTGFIRSHFVSPDATSGMENVVNAFRVDLALKGVEALSSGDLDVIEEALRNPDAYDKDTADERLKKVRAALHVAAGERFDLAALEMEFFNSPGGRGYQISFENIDGALLFDASLGNDPEAPVEVYLILDGVAPGKRRKAVQAALRGGFTIDPEGEVDAEATVNLQAAVGETLTDGSVTISQLCDVIGEIQTI